MKKDIHPDYQVATVKCVCGNEFQTRSTLKEISVEICSACHPFFTGQQKLIDSAGRVDRFLRKYGKDYASKAEKKASPKEPVEEKPAGKAEKKAEEKPAGKAEEKPAAQAETSGEPAAEEKPKDETGGEAEADAPASTSEAGEDTAEATSDDTK
jgi:large subunit ribosomal protein L31